MAVASCSKCGAKATVLFADVETTVSFGESFRDLCKMRAKDETLIEPRDCVEMAAAIAKQERRVKKAERDTLRPRTTRGGR